MVVILPKKKSFWIKTGIAVHSALDGLFNSNANANDDYKIVKDHYKKGDIVLIVCMEDTAKDDSIQLFFEEIKFIGSGSYSCNLAIDKWPAKKY